MKCLVDSCIVMIALCWLTLALPAWVIFIVAVVYTFLSVKALICVYKRISAKYKKLFPRR